MRSLCIVMVVAAGCSGKSKPGADAGDAGDAGRITPSAVCDRYLTCLSEYAPEAFPVSLQVYRPDGPCWQSPAAASRCEVACKEALAKLAEKNPSSSSCQTPPDASVPSLVDFGPILPGAVDILFVVDNSNSMEQEQANLVANFRKLIDGLDINVKLLDLHIGVISTDVGAGQYPLPTCSPGGDGGKLQVKARRVGCSPPSDPWISHNGNGVTNVPGATGDSPADLAAAFQCIAELGVGGCGFESPLESAKRALDPAVNPGFIRSGALLAVVFLTDEDDCSAQKTALFDSPQRGQQDAFGPLTSFRCTEFGLVCDQALRPPGGKTNCKPGLDWLHKVDSYVTFFRGLKPAGRVILAAIAGPVTGVEVALEGNNPVLRPTCQSINGTAVPAIRLKSVIDAFGSSGLFNKGINDQGAVFDVTICSSDFGPAMKAVANAVSKAL